MNIIEKKWSFENFFTTKIQHEPSDLIFLTEDIFVKKLFTIVCHTQVVINNSTSLPFHLLKLAYKNLPQHIFLYLKYINTNKLSTFFRLIELKFKNTKKHII